MIVLKTSWEVISLSQVTYWIIVVVYFWGVSECITLCLDIQIRVWKQNLEIQTVFEVK